MFFSNQGFNQITLQHVPFVLIYSTKLRSKVIMFLCFCVYFQGLVRNRIRKHLLVFAAAAPIMALVTYFGLSQVIIQKCYYM